MNKAIIIYDDDYNVLNTHKLLRHDFFKEDDYSSPFIDVDYRSSEICNSCGIFEM